MGCQRKGPLQICSQKETKLETINVVSSDYKKNRVKRVEEFVSQLVEEPTNLTTILQQERK